MFDDNSQVAKGDTVSLSVILPGLLDKADYASTARLRTMLRSDLGKHVIMLDMFRLPGIKKATDEDDTYHCEWTPAQYILAIKKAIESAKARYRVTDVDLIGFSYGAQVALLFAIADAGFHWKLSDRIVTIMPPAYFHWEGDGYSSERDWLWHLQQYHQKGFIDMGTLHKESRARNLNDPTSETLQVQITRRAIASHIRPFEGLLNNSSLSVSVPSLPRSGLLKYVKAKTLVISGEANQLAPDSVESVNNIFQGLPKSGHKEFVSLRDVMHDYRADPEQISSVNAAIHDWMLTI